MKSKYGMLVLTVCIGLWILPAPRAWAQDKAGANELPAAVPNATVKSDTISEKDLIIEKSIELHQRVALRPWYAQWKENSSPAVDHGYGFFNQLYYTLFLNKWYIMAMCGEGGYIFKDAWNVGAIEDAKRLDGQVGLGRAIGPLSLGLSARYSTKQARYVAGKYLTPEVLQRDTVDQTYNYYGPEAFVGIGIPIGKSGFSIAGSATIAYMFVDVNNDYIEYNGPGKLDNSNPKGSTTTTGYTFDGSLRYAVNIFQISAGYRIQVINKWSDITEHIGPGKNDNTTFDGCSDMMQGPYVEVAAMW